MDIKMEDYIKTFTESLDNIINGEEITETTKIELQMEIDSLRFEFKQEMIAQNNKGSVSRSYAKADSIRRNIQDLERKLNTL
jgi:hypothetical protein